MSVARRFFAFYLLIKDLSVFWYFLSFIGLTGRALPRIFRLLAAAQTAQHRSLTKRTTDKCECQAQAEHLHCKR